MASLGGSYTTSYQSAIVSIRFKIASASPLQLSIPSLIIEIKYTLFSNSQLNRLQLIQNSLARATVMHAKPVSFLIPLFLHLCTGLKSKNVQAPVSHI